VQQQQGFTGACLGDVHAQPGQIYESMLNAVELWELGQGHALEPATPSSEAKYARAMCLASCDGTAPTTFSDRRPRGVDLRRVTEFYQGMTRSADELVTEFCKLWASPDPEQLAGYFTDDAIYHNIPMDPVQGREAIKVFIAGFTAAFDGIDFQVHRQVSDGNLVMNERTDVMHRKDGGEIPLPVMGTFEVVDGKISAWRDYFDMATITSAFG
jgi:limonene-1,2-epoxide hydrolase